MLSHRVLAIRWYARFASLDLGFVQAMITEMGEDHDNFPCDMKGIDWQQYNNIMVLGIKKFLLKVFLTWAWF